MTVDRDRFIAAQNSATVAATLLVATGDVPNLPGAEVLDAFEALRQAIFDRTIELGQAVAVTEEQGAQIIHAAFPGTQQLPPPQNQQQYVQPPAAPAPPPQPAQPAATSGPVCPKCGGAMYDNRQSKRSPKQPDFRCKRWKPEDGGCDGVIWPPRGGH